MLKNKSFSVNVENYENVTEGKADRLLHADH
jgi:hypothetical protein